MTALALGQMSYNGVTFGPGGVAQIVSVEGLTGFPDVRDSDVSRPNLDGMLAGYDWLGGRSISLDLEVTATGGQTVAQNLALVRAAFQKSTSIGSGVASPTGQRLVYNLGEGGSAGPGVNRWVTARTRKFDNTVDAAFAGGGFQNGYATLQVQMETVDPFIYDGTIQTATVGLATLAGGWTFPWQFPWQFGSSAGGLIYAPNLGWATCYPVITFTGPCTNPRVEQETTGATMGFNLTLAATDTLVVDCYAGTATLDGQVDRMSTIQAGSTVISIPPGSNTLGFFSNDAAPTGAQMTVQWANTWS